MSRRVRDITGKEVVNDRLIEEVAEELGISKLLVKSVVNSQFDMVATTMRMNTMYGIMLPYFGKFKVKAERLHSLYHRLAKVNIDRNTSKPK